MSMLFVFSVSSLQRYVGDTNTLMPCRFAETAKIATYTRVTGAIAELFGGCSESGLVRDHFLERFVLSSPVFHAQGLIKGG